MANKNLKKFTVAIDKRYFIKPNPERLTSIQFKPIKVYSDYRTNAALKVWAKYGEGWLKQIRPECKHISLYVSQGKTVFWRLPLIKVFKR